MPEKQAEWLNLSGAAEFLGVHPSTVRAWADRGELPAHRTAGGHRRFRRSDLMLWASANRSSPASEGQLLMQNAIGRARLEVAEGTLRNQPWYQAFDESARAAHRDMGRRLLRQLVAYLGPEPELALAEARLIGRQYASMGRQARLSVGQTVRAFLFFRDLIAESLFSVYEMAGVRSAHAWAELNRRLATFASEVLLALIEGFNGNEAT
jgi:excisionase family DNA binding protein